MTDARRNTVLRIAALVTLVSLALMMWSFFDQRPIVLVVAMSVGQGIGTLALLVFMVVVLLDLRRARVLGHDEPGAATPKGPAPADQTTPPAP